jgi:hypothetical protein
MFKKFFGRRVNTGDAPEFADTVVERREEPRPLRPLKENDRGLMEANFHFMVINDAFPHIGKSLKVYWGYQEFVSYTRNLLHDNRGHSRKGFPMEVLMALQSLSDLHGVAYPHILPKDKLWSPLQSR